MNFELDLTKEGQEAPVFALSLDKGEEFTIQLKWDGDADLDLHGLHAINKGAGAKIASFGDILSTYNVKRKIGGKEVGTLELKQDRSFGIHNDAVTHSPDARNGVESGVDEWMHINPALLSPPPGGAIEIPILVLIHPQSTGKTFQSVTNAHIVVLNANNEPVMDVSLSKNFASYNGVHAGSIMVEASGSSFVALGVGFNGDFNSVLKHFC